MMKFRQFLGVFPLAVLALMLGACDNDEILNGESENGGIGGRVPMTFTATADVPQTRTVLANKKKVAWQKGDAISILPFNAEGVNNNQNDKFTTEDNSFTATFNGFTAEDAISYIAIYPYRQEITGSYDSEEEKYPYGLDNLSIPSEQKAVAGTFNPLYNISVGYTKKESPNLILKNICGLIKFRMAGNEAGNVKKIILTTEDGAGLAINSFELKFNETLSSYSLRSLVGSETSTSITLTAPDEGFKANTDYCFVVYPSGVNGKKIKISFIGEDENSPILQKESTEKMGFFSSGDLLNLGEFVVGEFPEITIPYSDLLSYANANAGLQLDSHLDGDGNLQMTEEVWKKLASVKELTIGNLANVTDFTDIKYFTGLTKLTCQTSGETLDLSCLPQLEEFNCNGCSNLKNLNIAGLYNLKTINCQSCSLTELNVKDLVSLTSLDCSLNSSLQKLNLANLPSLTSLQCFGCRNLSALEVNEFMNLQTLLCASNKLEKLDVDKLTKLKTLDCSSNKLEKLDVGKLTGLQTLKCYGNSLTTLSIVNNTNLGDDLWCGNQKGETITDFLTLTLSLTSEQLVKWNDVWSKIDKGGVNKRVEPSVPSI